MKLNKITIVAIIVVVILAVGATVLLSSPSQENQGNQNNQGNKENLSLGQVTEILSSSSDYAEFLATNKNFDPELSEYFKLSPSEYEKIKPQWKEQGFEDRVGIVDKIDLTESTYWVELKNKAEGANLLAILDLKEKKSLLIMGSIVIQAGVGL